MKIFLENENLRKPLYDIFNIFYDYDQIIFVNRDLSEDFDIAIYDSYLEYDGRRYDFLDKNKLKSTLYKILVEKTGYKSPWGMITGTKPSKLLYKFSPSEIKQKYFLSDKKINLLKSIKNQQDKLDFNKEDFSLYINIPFCPSRCDYCSYPTLIGKSHDKNRYMDYLIREIGQINLPDSLDAIYIGGGTPSYLDKDNLRRLLDAINNRFTYKELTFEAGREDTLDKAKLDILKKGGVGRISLNPQTFNREILLSLNRDIDLEHFYSIYDYAKDLGFIVNMDFIIGLLGENSIKFSNNFQILEKLLPDNISFHALAIKSGSKYKEENVSTYREDALIISDMINKFVNANYYKPYYMYRQKNIISNLENIGYQRNSTWQRYNIIINEEIANIIGLGMNSNSKLISGKKFRNDRNLRDYYNNFESSLMAKNQLIRKYMEDKSAKKLC